MGNISDSVLRPFQSSFPLHLISHLRGTWLAYSPLLLKPHVWASSVLSYLFLVRILRYRRLARTKARYPSAGSLSGMTIQEAQEIWLSVAQLEFPLMVERGIQFALFRTYGIPSISALLVRTSLFSEPASASKRYVDTAALVIEFTVRDFASEPWIQALARLNCIHGQYIKAGKIRNDDMIYTLTLFAREPVLWVERYEWRAMDDVEKCALGVFWKAIGDAMEIEWTGLPGHDSGKGWRDGLHWLNEACDWAETYEAKNMVPDDNNAKTAEQTTAILLWNLPTQLRGRGKQAVAALMDERLRRAMKFDEPPMVVSRLLDVVFSTRRFLLRHCALPRPWILRYHNVTDERSPQDTIFMKTYQSLPYYVKPTFWNRWGPEAFVSRLMGLPLPGDEGDKYYPGGYRTVDVGPRHGKKDQAVMESRVGEIARARCPYVF